MFSPIVHLEIDFNTKTAKIVDQTDYSELDFNVVTVTGEGVVTAPDGSVVVSGITIDISGGDTETASFPLPLDNQGNVLAGTYNIEYAPEFVVTNEPIDQFTTGPNTIWVAGQNWENILAQPNDLVQVTVSGATTAGNDGVKDLAAPKAVWNGLETEIVISTALTAEAGGSAVISFNTKYTTFYDQDVVAPISALITTPTLSATYDCDSTQFGQIIFQDTTELPSGSTLVSRTWDISYPDGLTNPPTPADITSTSPSVTVNTLATGTWTGVLTYVVEVLQNDGLVYTYTKSSGAKEVKVSCAGSFCALLCSLEAFFNKIAGAVECGKTSPYGDTADVINGYYTIAVEAKKCGDQEKYSEYYAKIVALLGDCNSGCGCSGGCSGGCAGDCGSTNGCGCNGEEAVGWVDNGSDVFGGGESEAIFATTTPISDDGNLSPNTTVLPATTFGTIALTPDNFQFGQELSNLGLTFGKKFVDVSYELFAPVDDIVSTLTIGGTTIYSIQTFLDDLLSVNVRIGTKRSGLTTIYCIQSVWKKIDAAGAVTYANSYNEIPNASSTQNLNVVHATSDTNAAFAVVSFVKADPFKVK
jgi:hypothetical protein